MRLESRFNQSQCMGTRAKSMWLVCILEMSRGENCSSRFKRRRTIACDVQSMVGEFIVLAIIADVVGGDGTKSFMDLLVILRQTFSKIADEVWTDGSLNLEDPTVAFHGLLLAHFDFFVTWIASLRKACSV